MAMAVLARTLSLQRANSRARTFRRTDGSSISPEQIAVNSCRVSQSIDALYVLSCLRDGLSPADAFVSDEDSVYCSGSSKKRSFSSLISDRMERVSEMWDRDFSSMSSYGSDCAEISGKETLACSSIKCRSADKLDALAEDFCLVFNSTDSSSPSPPSSSDCCFPSRKSNPNEDDVRGLMSRKTSSNQSDANLHEISRKSNHNEDDLRVLMPRESSQSDANLHTISRKSKAKVEDLHSILRKSRPIDADDDHDLQCVLRESIAVEKFSCNPYQDFRESMLQMIMAKGLMQRSMDMEDLLYGYLRLNSMEVHELIKRAFSDIWSELLMQIC